VVIENRPQPVIHAEIVAKAPPDGHTLLMGQFSSHASPPSLYKKLAYDPIKDFSAITLVSKAPLLLVAHPSIPASNVHEFIAFSRKRPGEVRFAAQSGSSNGRLTMEYFAQKAGLKMLYVPYKGPALSLNALLAQEAQVSFLTVAATWPQVKAGKLKAYAISSERRFSAIPEIPTVSESGVPGFESSVWFAVFAPAGMQSGLNKKINLDVVGVLRTPAFQSAMLAQGAEVSPSTPEQLTAFVKSEITKWGEIIRAIGIKPE
jgi:tripartite-type tricarboxylate transporter receptor subunit TctC